VEHTSPVSKEELQIGVARNPERLLRQRVHSGEMERLGNAGGHVLSRAQHSAREKASANLQGEGERRPTRALGQREGPRSHGQLATDLLAAITQVARHIGWLHHQRLHGLHCCFERKTGLQSKPT
jgi:hypothetical protein